jgi:hypothetical protein
MFAQAITNRKLDLADAPANGAAGDHVTIRRSGPGDGRKLFRLALLDDRRMAAGPHLIAERGGEIVAAVPLGGGAPIADPFVRSADLVSLLELRVRQLAC